VAPTTVITAVQVVITSAPQAAITTAAALRGGSSVRYLQAIDNSVTIAYDITNIPAQQQQLL
jgi:hypothetical protein